METMMGDVLSTVAQFDPWRHTGPWESTKPNINTPRLGLGHLGTQSKGLFLSWLWDYLFFHKLFHIYSMRLFIFTFKLMFADYNENEFYLQVDLKYWPCLSISQLIWGQTMVRLSSMVGSPITLIGSVYSGTGTFMFHVYMELHVFQYRPTDSYTPTQGASSFPLSLHPSLPPTHRHALAHLHHTTTFLPNFTTTTFNNI